MQLSEENEMGGKDEYLGEKKIKTHGKYSDRKGVRRALRVAKYSGKAFVLREKIANFLERLEKRKTAYLGEKRVERTQNSAFERAFTGRFAVERVARNIQF